MLKVEKLGKIYIAYFSFNHNLQVVCCLHKFIIKLIVNTFFKKHLIF